MRRLTLQITLWLAFMAAVLFWPAGTFDWRGGWIYLGEITIGTVAITWWMLRHSPELLRERLGSPLQKKQVFWDKVLMAIIFVGFYGWMALMGLDAKRWGLSHVPERLSDTGAVLIAICFFIAWLTFRENSFAAPVVKIQSGQTVISTGPYRFVRHPMYASALFYFLGMPLLLGSWIGLACTPLLVVALMIRILIEERALRQGLAGYDDYAARVRYRLVPYVW